MVTLWNGRGLLTRIHPWPNLNRLPILIIHEYETCEGYVLCPSKVLRTTAKEVGIKQSVQKNTLSNKIISESYQSILLWWICFWISNKSWMQRKPKTTHKKTCTSRIVSTAHKSQDCNHCNIYVTKAHIPAIGNPMGLETSKQNNVFLIPTLSVIYSLHVLLLTCNK